MKIKRALVAFSLAAATVAANAIAQPIKVGELNSYKRFPAFLEPYKQGWQLALEEINAAGGINGRKLEVVSRDDGGNPGAAVRVADELISRDKVAMLMGEFASNIGLEANSPPTSGWPYPVFPSSARSCSSRPNP